MSTSPLPFSIRLGRGFKTDSESVATSVRGELGIARHDRLKARALARYLGIKVRYPKDLPSVAAAGLDALIRPGTKQAWSAVFIKVVDRPGLVITNPHHTPAREESNIFHELAHYICGHEPIRIDQIGGLPFREFDNEQERQAEYLGFALHLNRDSLFHSVKHGLNEAEICSRYCASAQLVRHRMNITQVKRILRVA